MRFSHPRASLVSAILPFLPALLLERALYGQVRLTLHRLAAGSEPIIVGPWLGEPGYELLYWIPFLHWASDRRLLDPARAVIISRGGAAPWYAGLGSAYHDVFDFLDADEFRHRNEARAAEQGGELKQWRVSSFDHEIIRRVRQHRRAPTARVLHPSLMFRLFEPFWRQLVTVRHVERHTRHAPLPPPALTSPQLGLPARYVAAKFYFNAAFPNTEPNRAFVNALVADLARRHEVVMLTTGLHLDDHAEYQPPPQAGLHTAGELISDARTNLTAQTAIVAGATAFVGNYGGFAYLAPSYGVTSLCFYSDPVPGHPFPGLDQHLELARRRLNTVSSASFVCLHTRDLSNVERLVGGESLPANPRR